MPSTRISTIETHPQRQAIIKALAEEQSYRQIEKWTEPTVSTGALSRFKRHSMHVLLSAVTEAKQAIAYKGDRMPASAVQSVTRAALTAAVDPFAAAALRTQQRHERWIDDLEQSPDLDTYKVMAQIDRNNLAAQEYAARLAGRLADTANTTNNTSVSVYLSIPREDLSRSASGGPGSAPGSAPGTVTVECTPTKSTE